MPSQIFQFASSTYSPQHLQPERYPLQYLSPVQAHYEPQPSPLPYLHPHYQPNYQQPSQLQHAYAPQPPYPQHYPHVMSPAQHHQPIHQIYPSYQQARVHFEPQSSHLDQPHHTILPLHHHGQAYTPHLPPRPPYTPHPPSRPFRPFTKPWPKRNKQISSTELRGVQANDQHILHSNTLPVLRWTKPGHLSKEPLPTAHNPPAVDSIMKQGLARLSTARRNLLTIGIIPVTLDILGSFQNLYSGPTFQLLRQTTSITSKHKIVLDNDRPERLDLLVSLEHVCFVKHQPGRGVDGHWVCVRVNLKLGHMLYVDPLGRPEFHTTWSRDTLGAVEAHLRRCEIRCAFRHHVVAPLIAQNDGTSCGPLTWYEVENACGLSAQKSDIQSIRLGHLEQVVTQLLFIGHDSPLPRVRVHEAPDHSILEVLDGSPLPNGTRGRPAIPTATFHPVLTDSKKRSRPIAPVASPSRSLVQALSEELEANDSVQDPPSRFPRWQSAKRQRTSTTSVQDRSISPNPDAESSIEKHPSDNPSLLSRLDLFNRIDPRIVQHMTAVRSLRDCRNRIRLVKSHDLTPIMKIEYLVVGGVCFVVDPARSIINFNPCWGMRSHLPTNQLKSMHECKFWFVDTSHRPKNYLAHIQSSSWFPRDELDVMRGLWTPIRNARRFLMLMPQWSDQLDQFLLYDDSKQLRDLFVDAPRPFLDDSQLLVCPLCPKGFESKLDFNLHVSLHEFGHCHIADCCLGSSLSRAVHKHHDSLGAGLKGISFGDRPSLLGSLTSIWDAARRADPDRTSGFDKGGFHEWTLVVQIARYSLDFNRKTLDRQQIAYESAHAGLRTVYARAFDPVVGHLARMPLSGSCRSSRYPWYNKPRSHWVLTATPDPSSKAQSRQIELEEEDHAWSSRPSCLGSVLNQLPPKARFLFLCQSLEGLSTNLIFLIRLSRDPDDYDAWLGIKFGSKKVMVQMGQFQRGSHTWAFYRFSRLRDCIVGSVHDPAYEAVVRVWFLIQKTKQAYANSLSGTKIPRLGGPGRNNYNLVVPIDLGLLDADADAESNNEYSNDESDEAE